MIRGHRATGLWVVLGLLLFGVGPSGRAFAQQPDSVVERKTRINAYPFVFYTPETGLAFGGGGVATFYTEPHPELRPSSLTLAGYYSTVKQYSVSLVPRLYFGHNRWLATAILSLGRIVDGYWGVGNDSPDVDSSRYVTNSARALLDMQMPSPLGRRHRWAILYDIESRGIVDRRHNPLLLDPDLVGYDGGLVSGAGLGLIWDTRGNVFYPEAGMFHQARAIFYSSSLGSDFGFTSYELDLRGYVSPWRGRVFALQLYSQLTTGNVPFYRLPALGGEYRMRGYFLGRYRDKDYVAAQVEFRTYVYRRLGVVAFAGVGEVMPRLADFRLSAVHPSVGGGLRFLFSREERVNLRADFGIGEGTSGVYFGVEEAF